MFVLLHQIDIIFYNDALLILNTCRILLHGF